MRWKVKMSENCVALSLKWSVIGEKERAKLYERAQEWLGKYYGELRLGEFFDCMNADYSVIMDGESDWNKCNNAQFLWAMGFAEYLKAFFGMMKKLQVPMSNEERAAQAFCMSVSFEESVLVFVREYFGLQSFKACDDITINEYIIAKKHAYNRAVVQQKVNELTMQKGARR